MSDRSGGYDSVSEQYISGRTDSHLGIAELRAWVKDLPKRAAVLDLGCGGGVPISQILVEAGFAVHGVDASPSMIKAFQKRFPGTPVACQPAEESHFFARKFDGAVAWGLMFLLSVKSQAVLIRKLGTVLKSKGRLLFTSPAEQCDWKDALTGAQSQSPGRQVYASILSSAGFSISAEYADEGGNHYYDAVKN